MFHYEKTYMFVINERVPHAQKLVLKELICAEETPEEFEANDLHIEGLNTQETWEALHHLRIRNIVKMNDALKYCLNDVHAWII
jgi:hypothetical protein